MTKKIFAMFLAVLMVVSMLPTSVFAAGCPAVHTKSNCEYTEVKVTDPNCGVKGYTTYKCNACDETFVADFTNPVGEHTWEDAPYVAPTCQSTGSEGGKKCSVCETVVNATVIPALGVNLKCEYGEYTPAYIDCTVGGTQKRYCKHCGGEDKANVIKHEAAEDHDLGEWELVTPATAEANGLAVKKCKTAYCNYQVEQVVLFDHDHEKNVTLTYVAEQAAKCEETGVKAHWLCRICGVKMTEKSATDSTLVVKTDADLVIKTLHEQKLDELNCMTTTYVCTAKLDDGKTCNKVLKVDAAASHQYGDWVVFPEPTCTTDGFKVRTCTVCEKDSETKVIPALGHLEGEWTVPATCIQYAYTFTYCMRNCGTVKKTENVKIGETDVSFDLTKGHTILAKPETNLGFYLNMVQGNLDNKSLFFTGKTANETYYLATSDKIADGVKVFLEEVKVEGVENAYHMYFNNGDVKTYIYIYQSGSYVNAGISAEVPTTYWTWNEEYKVLTTKVGEDSYFLGTRGDKEYTTFSACKMSYAAENFLSRLYVSNKDGVSLLNITPNTAAGFDNTNHRWKNLTNLTASCMNDVVNSFLCEDCGASKTEKLDKLADHNWDNGTVTKPATCTDKGEKEFKCQVKGCSATKKEEIAAKNHSNLTLEYTNGPVKVFTESGSHTSPISYKYNVCFDCKERVNKRDYKAWADAGKLWDTKEAAEVEHDLAEIATVTVNGSCTVVGYNGYACSGCSEVVRVKIDGTGAHVFPEAGITIGETPYTKGYQAPTCTADGYSINYKCTRCEKLIDEEATENKLTVIPKLGHTWTEFTAEERETLELGEYEKAPCGTPVYNNWIGYCSVCHEDGLKKADLAAAIAAGSVQADTKRLEPTSMDFDGALCVASIYELYECHCGETHMRSFLVTEVNVDHEWIVDSTKEKLAPTHFTEGHIDMICKYCRAEAPAEMEVIAKLPHKNAADEEFTNACNDKITDRHCVLCCAAECKADKKHDCVNNKDEDGEADPCDCVITKDHNWGNKTYVGSVCGEAPYVSEICSICYQTKAVDSEKFVGADGKEYPVVDLGHKPVAVDVEAIYGESGGLIDEKPVRYAAYDYVPGYKHYTYKWVNVALEGEAAKYELQQFVETYEAKFIEYKAATNIADGYAKFLCADCGNIIEQVLPATAGLGFSIEYVNANGAEEITVGSVVNVTIYASGADVAVNTFTLNAQFKNLVYVASQSANDNFRINVTDAKNANGDLVIVATAINTADKKQQNITIGEKTPVVTLQFVAVEAGKTEVTMTGEAFDVAAKDAIACAGKCELVVETFLDFNEDGFFHISDLIQAETVLTGESEKTYDVVIDVDKDGEITLFDLNLIYEFYVNEDYTNEKALAEFACYGLSDVHAALVDAYLNPPVQVVHCKNPYCLFSANTAFETCPACNRAQ